MKGFLAFACLMVFTVVSDVSAQSAKVGIASTFSGGDLVMANFRAEPGVEYMVFETVIRAKTLEECMAATSATPGKMVAADRMRLEYNDETGEYEFGIFVEREYKPTCRIVSVRSGVELHDLNIWRTNFGTSGAGSDSSRMGDGSVRFVSY